jgi:transcriptional regulator with XRE-family HTH domain
MGVVVKRARKELHLTLEKLAERCGVSKSMLSQIERGQVNPTFSVVWNLTQSLGLDLNLLGEQSAGKEVIEHTHSYSTPTMKSADGSCTLRLLSPAHTVLSVEWYEVVMEPKGSLDSNSHVPGTYEHFTCQTGSVRIESGKQIASAVEGDTLRYHADRPHRIINTSSGVSSGLLVVALP